MDALMQTDENALSRGQRKIARFIKEFPDRAAFMTAGKLAETVGVSESTVVRFAADIGYPGYPEMKRALQDLVRGQLTSVQRISAARDSFQNIEDIPTAVLKSDCDNLRITLENIDRAEFRKAVNAITSAKRIFLLGSRGSAMLAEFMGYYLGMLFENVRVLSANDEIQIAGISRNDVFIGISFPRYSHQTVKALKFAAQKGAEIIAITDNSVSPIARIANITIFAKSDMVGFADSLIAPLSVINAIVAAIGMTGGDKVLDRFKELDALWNEYEVYEK